MRSARLSGPTPYGAGPFYFIWLSTTLDWDHSKKTFVLCVSSERNERVVKRIINPDCLTSDLMGQKRVEN
jgi:hypothetical protein